MATHPVELFEAKLVSPVRVHAPVPRTDLVRRLSSARSARVVSIIAAPGFGKTTLLTQWLASDERPFAWITLDERDNDPVIFLTYVAVALDQVSPIDVGVFEALATTNPLIEGKVIPRLSAAMAGMKTPVVLVLDDLHVLSEPRCLDALATLVLHLPVGVQIAIAGRVEPALPLPRMRAEGIVLDIGPGDLTFDAEEAKLQLDDAGIDLTDREIDQLMDSTEGWPAGLYLAALSMRAKSSPSSAASFSGDDPFVGDYLRAEFLQNLSPRIRSFLVRTSALDEMSGSLCDTILDERDSSTILESLARQNLMVIPQDRHEEWYRYHHLFRDLLMVELRKEPGLGDELRRRAAHWYEANGHDDLALDYAQEANDPDHAARLFKRAAIDAYRTGRLATAIRWLTWFDEHNHLHRYPLVALAGAWLQTLTGEAEAALALSSFADGQLGDELLWDDITPADAWAAQLRALWCRDGVEAMRRDAEIAFDMTPEASSQRAPALLFRGVAKMLQGDDAGADADFVDTVEIGSRTSAPHAIAIALAQRASSSIKKGNWTAAEELMQQALAYLEEHHLEEYPTSAIVYAVSAHVTFHQYGDQAAHDHLIRAQRLRPQLTYSIPWLAVQARIESGRTYLAMADPAGARTVVREAETIFRRCPNLGVLRAEVNDLRRLVRDAPAAAPGMSTLTSAELRLLPYLSTHLTFPEMGDRLYVSRHTVKSQAISIYRKLEVSSRSEAVRQAARLGLLEP